MITEEMKEAIQPWIGKTSPNRNELVATKIIQALAPLILEAAAKKCDEQARTYTSKLVEEMPNNETSGKLRFAIEAVQILGSNIRQAAKEVL